MKVKTFIIVLLGFLFMMLPDTRNIGLENRLPPSYLHSSDFNNEYQDALNRLDTHLENIQLMNSWGFNDLNPLINEKMNAALQHINDAKALNDTGDFLGANTTLDLAEAELDALDILISNQMDEVTSSIQRKTIITVVGVTSCGVLIILLVFIMIRRKRKRVEGMMNAEIDYEKLDQEKHASESWE